MARICIIDDEPKSAEVLEALIHDVEVNRHDICIFTDPFEAVEALPVIVPDIVFLDIRMPGMSGFDLLQVLPERPFAVVFTTAYEQYAIQAIKLSAFDYLLKPVEDSDLQAVFDRLHQRRRQHTASQLAVLNANLNIREPQQYKICLSTAERKYFIAVHRIVRCEADGNYTTFHLADRSRLLSSRTLKEHEEILATQGFVRVHKSHLINPRYIDTMISSSSIKMADESTVPLARRRRKKVRAILQLS
ncbi:MAG: LytTR family DNA-binding domain-containing protein [Saprospiraceae bacterium]|nr:LytTR family DNA-binding domain-containing protein [Saprospiraceae bacterium]